MMKYMEDLISKIKDVKINLSLSQLTQLGVTAVMLLVAKLHFRGGQNNASQDLTGKVAVITGGNTGIGKWTVDGLVKHNCTVVFGARDDAKSQQAMKEIQAKYPKGNVRWINLNLGDRESIREFVNKVKDSYQSVDILINNAAVMAVPTRKITENGFEMQMGINHIGHFYLTYLLWPLIKKSPEPRIITVSSKAHSGFGLNKTANFGIDFEDINFNNNYEGGVAYGRSKAANILFARSLQSKMDEQNINGLSVSLHPGVVRTQLSRYMGFFVKLLTALTTPLRYIIMKSAKQGAQTSLYLALERTDKLSKGEYYADCKVVQTSEFTKNMANADRLWQLTEKELSIKFHL